jgi:transposase-like protein
MPRYPQAPWDYDCTYKHCCPHLQGLSTAWVFDEYQRSHYQHLQHWQFRDEQLEELDKTLAYISDLEKQNQQLKAKLRALHQRQFKANKKKNTDDQSADSPKGVKKKKQGAPTGHPGWSRSKPDHIDKTVLVPAPQNCPHCNCSDLTSVEDIKDHLQEDIVLQPRTFVINFKHHQAFCPKCRRNVVKCAEGELLNCHIGPTTKAVAVYLRYGLQLPYRKVKQLFDVLFNMPFVPASAMAFDRTATRKGQPLYEDLKQKVHNAASVHADETSWRQDGIGHYLWYAGNDQLAFYLIERHRSAKVVEKLLGDDFQGVLNTDDYAAYNAANAKQRQTCLAHIIRRAKEIKQEIVLRKEKYQDPQAIEFCDQIRSLLKDACHVGGKLKNRDAQDPSRNGLQKLFYDQLDSICNCQLDDDKTETLRTRLRDPTRLYHRLFTFLKYPQIEPTNNQAEQSLRYMVIFRKICFGTRSYQGSLSHSVLPSLLMTARRQGQHPLTFFETLFTSDTATAQTALYNGRHH